MNILIVDISGRVFNYDVALCNAICEQKAKEDNITFITPFFSSMGGGTMPINSVYFTL